MVVFEYTIVDWLGCYWFLYCVYVYVFVMVGCLFIWVGCLVGCLFGVGVLLVTCEWGKRYIYGFGGCYVTNVCAIGHWRCGNKHSLYDVRHIVRGTRGTTRSRIKGGYKYFLQYLLLSFNLCYYNTIFSSLLSPTLAASYWLQKP